jgi:predicted nucleotidyltransferase
MISLRSKISQAVLNHFFLHEGEALYVNQMARRLSLDDGNLARKLRELEKEGILRSETKGKERYYSLNSEFPLLNEYKKIVLKTVGFEKLLRDELREIQGIQKAYLFGSYAQNKMDAVSDIDLLVVGDHDTVDLQRKISKLQQTVNREINVVSLSPAEYQRRRRTDPFLRAVEKKPKIVLR